MVINPKQNILLIILDGWGVYQPSRGNAITQAKLPFYNGLVASSPFALLEASGEAVGLPKEQIGTSEVNHLTIGAGRILFQNLVRINRAIEDKSFFTNPSLTGAFTHASSHRSALHLIGLYSDGGVHSHSSNLKALGELAARSKFKRVFLHLFSDGRDTLPTTGRTCFQDLEGFLKKSDIGTLSTITGRYYAMDRDENWGRTNRAFEALTQGAGTRFTNVSEVFGSSYEKGITDEYIEPAILTKNKDACIKDNDALIFFNFRADRMRQLVHLFKTSHFHNLYIATMTDYKEELKTHVAFPTISVTHHLTEVLTTHGITHHHISESEKYAHVTYFFNGRRERPYATERRQHIKSFSDVATHDLRPQMRAPEITEATKALIDRGEKGFIVVNFANSDIVGHTANIPAVIKACEAIDKALATVLPTAFKKGWTTIVTADHGNAEMLIDPTTSGPHTAHTLNPVPFILASPNNYRLKRNGAQLSDIAPTILTLMGIEQPTEMTGQSLV